MGAPTSSSVQQDNLKAAAAAVAVAAARARLDADPAARIGVGSGSTVERVIDALASARTPLAAVAAASERSEARLRSLGVPVRSPSEVSRLSCYLDGADEVDPSLALIKGGGGALAREKVLAGVADEFICVATGDKLRRRLGAFPLPVEALVAARAAVCARLAELGARVSVRETLTDNGNLVLDLHDFPIDDPDATETRLNQIPGVVCNGIFAHRRADALALATPGEARIVTALADDWPGEPRG